MWGSCVQSFDKSKSYTDVNWRVKYALLPKNFAQRRSIKSKLLRYRYRLLRPNDTPVPHVQSRSVRGHIGLSCDFCVNISRILYQYSYLRHICPRNCMSKPSGIQCMCVVNPNKGDCRQRRCTANMTSRLSIGKREASCHAVTIARALV
jgi:hypothetical protein